MPPKAMSQAAIERLITQRVNVGLEAERASRANEGGKEATQMKQEAKIRHLQALTWWNSQVATLGLNVAIGKSWGDMKKMMLEEFCPDEELRACWRGFSACKQFDRLRRNAAAVKIQNDFRLTTVATNHIPITSVFTKTGSRSNIAYSCFHKDGFYDTSHTTIQGFFTLFFMKRWRNYLGTHNTTNNMFRVKFSSEEHYRLMSSSNDNDSKVWHLRYGQLNVKGLQLLASDNMVNGLPVIQDLDHVYEGCALGKQTRKPFPVGQSKRAKKKLELIPANIYGPMKAQSLTCSNDFLLFIDDSTRMSGLYFLFHKSEALECFKKAKHLMRFGLFWESQFEMRHEDIIIFSWAGSQVDQQRYPCVIETNYVNDLLKQFGMENCKTASTPMNLNEKLTSTIGQALKMIGKVQQPFVLIGSSSFSWGSKKLAIVALSSIEDEYVDATASACQAVWLRRLLEDINHKQEHATEVFCDNMSAVASTRNPVMHGRTKHIMIKHHSIRKLVEEYVIMVEICKSSDQLADILTKPLAPAKFEDPGERYTSLRNDSKKTKLTQNRRCLALDL
nr:retrovirus-related Pol polyprotein from transposon TNT 1-94 [Tanacetum cinerariifolium]